MDLHSILTANLRHTAAPLSPALPVLFAPMVSGASAAAGDQRTPRDAEGFLAAMKRSNEIESDHRNIMTPEFRGFCIASREHVACCAAFLLLFVCAYTVVRRACMRVSRPLPLLRGAAPGVQHLVVPYAARLRSRQILLVIASVGLASAAMMAILIAVTVGLANAMEHGDPRSLRSWRTWLLPSTLLAPGDAQLGHLPAVLAAGPHVAHDFPPILRRLWLYQSIISVGTAAFLLPFGLLYEATSPRASTRRRLLAALSRWLAAAAGAFIVWEAVCWRVGFLGALGLYRPFSADGATIRYSVHFATCAFGLLPAVLVILPRGTWALFGWLQSCVGQQRELALLARKRHAQLACERERVERLLEQAIGSWKWKQFHDYGSLPDADADAEPAAPPVPHARTSMVHIPPAHPGLSHSAAVRPYQTVGAGRPRVASRRPHINDVLFPALSSIQLSGASPAAVAPLRERSLSPGRDAVSPHSPVLYYSSSSSDNDNSDSNGTASDLHARRIVRSARKRLWRQRESDMFELSRRIKKYHAQLVFIRAEMARIDASGVLDMAGDERTAATGTGPSRLVLLALAGARRASSLLTMAVATFCWLLLVLHVGRGALSAIFVGEPDLTHSFKYFIPALSPATTEAPAPTSQPGDAPPQATRPGEAGPLPLPLLPPLVTASQAVAGTLLFVVVLFGLLSVGSSVEDSVHPLRLLATGYAERILRARQWEWLPRVLLPAYLLAANDPTVAIPRLVAGGPPMRVAGHTSRAFFSSSADLTSYYRQIQQQGAPPPGTSLPDGVLPDAALQARALGRRVFLPICGGSRRAVPLRQMLAYAWIVCGLAMSWPTVLRATGLISERAYVLPIASLVEPLWSPYVFDEEVVLQPAWRPDAPLPVCAVVSRPAETLPDSCPTDKMAQCGLLGSLPSSACQCAAADNKAGVADMPEPLPAPAVPPAEHRASRRQLHQSLSSDTVPRLLVRWMIRLGAKVSLHVAISLGYATWWLDPDLIVPLSTTAVDLQLGFEPQVPAPLPAASFGAGPALSEWYGMLRRLERRTVRLPQADDGTPLVRSQAVQQPDTGGSASVRAPATAIGSTAASPGEYDGDDEAYVAAYLWDCLCAALQWLRQVVTACTCHAARAAVAVVRYMVAGTAVEPAGRAALGVARASVGAAYAAGFFVGHLLWNQIVDAAAVLPQFAAYADSLFSRAAAGAGWIGRGLLMADDPELVAGEGAVTAAPSVFMPAFWAVVVDHGDPGLQRLRPELWPHALGPHAVGGSFKPAPAPALPLPAQQPPASTGAAGDPPLPVSRDEPPVARGAWTASDWLLAVYRVLLGVLACRAVFGPSRSSWLLAL